MPFFRKKKNIKRGRSQKEYSFAWQIIKGTLRLLGLVLFLVCVYYVTRFNFFTIQHVDIEGGETISHDSIKIAVNDALDGTYFRLIPKRFIYMYPRDDIRSALEEIPRIHNLYISRTNRTSLLISFDEYLPHALLCLKDGGITPCLFVDEGGFAFAEAPNLQGGTLTRHIVSESGFEVGQFLEQDVLVGIDNFIQQSEPTLGFRITKVEHMPDRDISFFINGGGLILASLKRDLVETLENVAVVLDSEEFNHIEPGNFQYVDARFENKIFINENIATSTATSSEPLPE